jgi:hypothetical protein
LWHQTYYDVSDQKHRLLWHQTYYDVSDKKTNVSFEALDIIISILAILSISTPITTNILNIKPNIICYIGAMVYSREISTYK